MTTPDPPSQPPDRRVFAWITGFVAIGVASAAVPPLAVPAVVLTLIGALTFPPEARGGRRTLGRVATALAALGAIVGLGRFVASKAMLGMVEGGQSTAAFSALWKLREVVIAEDALRRTAPWDPDGDHIGSAALIGSLNGSAPLRGGATLEAPLLNYAFQHTIDTAIGPASPVEGYLFIVCLPTTSGGLTARPTDAIDDERAERRYVAYAWPSDATHGMATVFFADEHERLLVLDPPRGAAAAYLGAARPPACDAALGGDGGAWKAWKNKQPRKVLPGESQG